MIPGKQHLVDEQTSPLHRLMWVYNPDDPAKRTFENNICAFHIGNGYLLSVSHNLRLQAGYFKSIDEEIYRREILPKLDGSQKNFMEQHYFTDAYTAKMHLNTAEPEHLQNIAKILKQKRFDTRWASMAQRNICNPYMIIQFRTGDFYKNNELNKHFKPTRIIHEKEIGRYAFLLETELVDAWYAADIALYRIKNTPNEIIDVLPAIPVNFGFLDDFQTSLYCLQSAPNSFAGRLLNESKTEGILDNFNQINDDFGGNYTLEGWRYLVKGYFRFGSSGAPYLVYNTANLRYEVNAIQSEASGIQFSQKGDLEGNFQFTNAVATPLCNVRHELEKYL